MNTRRSISVRGSTYDALRIYCNERGESMSTVAERLISIVLSSLTKGPTTTPPPPPPREPDPHAPGLRGRMRAMALEGQAKKRATVPPGPREGQDAGGRPPPRKLDIAKRDDDGGTKFF